MVAIGGAIIRERFLVPGLGPPAGRAVGTLLVGVLIFELSYAFIGKLKEASQVFLVKLGLF